jgi:hypothetical protein
MSADLPFPRSAAFVVDPFVPLTTLSVTWPGSPPLADGATLTPTAVAAQPAVSLGAGGGLYTLILSDPDAPTPDSPEFAEWQHWRVVNAPAADLAAGDVRCAYFGSAPGQGSGVHRYVLVAYAQPGGARIAVDDAADPLISATSGFAPRRSFDSRAFAARHGLTPVAAITWRAQWDAMVPELAKKLTATA